MKTEDKIAPNQGKGASRIVATADEKTDLGAAADKVNKADTPHKAKAAPGLAVVVFAERLDKESAEKAEKALAKVKGVDAKGSKVDREKGEISVKLNGDHKVTIAEITGALKDAGIEAKTTKEKSKS